MRLLEIQVFRGKNIYSHKPVIKIKINIGKLYKVPTKEIQSFNQAIINLFPGIKAHRCSTGYTGGFIDRLKQGTYIPHVLEHLIIELQNMLDYDVCFGKARVSIEPSIYDVVYEYQNEMVGIECGKSVFKLVSNLVKGKKTDKVYMNNILSRISKIGSVTDLGPTTLAIYEEAKNRGIPVSRIGNESILKLGYGSKLRMIQAAISDSVSCINVDISCNKDLTKRILEHGNIPVPESFVVYDVDMALSAAKYLGYPIVVKPVNSNHGNGVTVNITNSRQLRQAFKIAHKQSNSVMVEEYIRGKDYRILVIGGKVSAVSERKPASVEGNGINTISELIDIENSKAIRGSGHGKPLTKIKADATCRSVLRNQGLDLNYIPKDEEFIKLRDNANLSTGGTARDCTNKIHPDNISIAVQAANLLGLDIAGVDITAVDIGESLIGGETGCVVEVNASPGLRMHLHPSEGDPQDVASDIIEFLFPDSNFYSIPIISVTGTNGKTTVVRMINHVLSATGKKTGMTSTDGIYINNKQIMSGDCAGPISAEAVLSNKEIEVAILETARGGIIRRGLGYDNADVAIITNIGEDHIGLDGLISSQDIAFVKSLVIEAVKPNGYSVLNADDSFINYLIKRVKGRLILFSSRPSEDLFSKYSNLNPIFIFVKGERIYIRDNKKQKFVLWIKDSPITFEGTVMCNVQNTLAAVSALYALNVPIDVIRENIRSFNPDIYTNPGRFNMFDMGTYKIMLDYGHNSEGYHEVSKLIKDMEANRKIGIIGIPGDRNKKQIEEVGKICSNTFSKIFIKEDSIPRIYPPGEVTQILFNSLIKNGMSSKNINIAGNEIFALNTAIKQARPGDMIVLFYEQLSACVDIIKKNARE